MITADEMWPEHAGHSIQYAEMGWVSYRLTALELNDVHEGIEAFLVVEDVDRERLEDEITDLEAFCATCGTPLKLERKVQP